MDSTATYRCAHCGNRTRFDVVDSVRRRRYLHYTLGGEASVDEEEIMEATIEKVVCRWCDRADGIEVNPPPPGTPTET